jgi:hypothetical protein
VQNSSTRKKLEDIINKQDLKRLVTKKGKEKKTLGVIKYCRASKGVKKAKRRK